MVLVDCVPNRVELVFPAFLIEFHGMPHVRIWARYGRAPAYVSSVRTLPPTVAAARQQIPTPGQVNGGREVPLQRDKRLHISL